MKNINFIFLLIISILAAQNLHSGGGQSSSEAKHYSLQQLRDKYGRSPEIQTFQGVPIVEIKNVIEHEYGPTVDIYYISNPKNPAMFIYCGTDKNGALALYKSIKASMQQETNQDPK